MTYTYIFDGIKRDIQSASYEQALRAIPHISDKEIIQLSATYTKGKTNGRSYRDFLVETKAKNMPEKVIYLKGEFTSEIVRVYGSYSGKSASL